MGAIEDNQAKNKIATPQSCWRLNTLKNVPDTPMKHRVKQVFVTNSIDDLTGRSQIWRTKKVRTEADMNELIGNIPPIL